jgi:hypothetical protein
MSDFTHVPIVDLSGRAGDEAERRALAGQLREICHEIGFLVITDFGVDPSVIGDVFDLVDAFFALPEADKALIDKARSPHFRGWEAVGAEQTNNRVDVREQIDLWSEWPVDVGGGAAYLQLLGPNQWMPDQLLPGGRAVMERWFGELGAWPTACSVDVGRAGPGRGSPRDLLRRPADVAHQADQLSAHPGGPGRRQRPPRHRLSHAARHRAGAGPASAEPVRGVDRRPAPPGWVGRQPG